MEPMEENTPDTIERHGCVTAWLVFMIIVNSITAFVYLFASEFIIDTLPGDVSTLYILLLGICGLANVIFSVMLFQWKKAGFWGFVITSVAAIFINISIGLGIGQSFFGLVGIAVLFGILQIEKNGISAWAHLNKTMK